MNDNVEKKESKKVYVIVILLLLLVVAVMGTIIVYDKIVNKNLEEKNTSEVKNDENNKTEELSLSDNTVNNLYNYFTKGISTIKGATSISFKSYIYENKKTDINNISDDAKFYYAWHLLKESDVIINNTNNNQTFTISYKTYDKAIKKIFGENVKYSVDKKYEFSSSNSNLLKNDEITISYDEKTNLYVGTYLLAGGVTIISPIYYELVSATKTDKEIILKEKFLFTDLEYNEDKRIIKFMLYSDWNKTNLVYSSDFISMDEFATKRDNIMKNYANLANTINYHFELGNDNEYYFSYTQIEK